MAGERLQQGDALVMVDVQRDFFPGGSTPVPGSEDIIPVLNDWIRAARDRNIPIIAVRDWHTVDHASFDSEGGELPPHCVQDTPGAFFHPSLRLSHEVIVVSKGTAFNEDNHSAFGGTGLEEFLARKGIRRLWIGGLTEDGSVRQTVEDACRNGFDAHLILDGTRPLDQRAEPEALQAMRDAGAVLDKSEQPDHTAR